MAKIKYPAVLAFEKKVIPSNGFFYSTNWEQRETVKDPLTIATKTVRGTKSNKGEKNPESSNIQTVDYCALPIDKDTLRMSFTVKFTSGVETPTACDSPEFSSELFKLVKAYKEKHQFTELAKRYASNITNGSCLWKNRIGAENVEVCIKERIDGTDTVIGKVAKGETGYREFDFDPDPVTQILADKIASVFMGEKEFLLLEIDAFAQVGRAQDIYPSEEFVQSKSESGTKEGVKSKELFSSDGIAAIHSQKIGNAIRTIDTWYDSFPTEKRAIAIEPFGSVTTVSSAFRNNDTNRDFYTLFEQLIEGEEVENVDDEHYVVANLIRGGVFGAKSS